MSLPTRRHVFRHRLSSRLECLEDRALPATGGTVFVHAFVDSNLNGQFDTFAPHVGESLIPGVRVYVDANNNGILDAGEPQGLTSTSFSFNADGAVTIRSEPLTGASRTTPDAITVSVSGGQLQAVYFGFAVTVNPSGVQEVMAVGAGPGGLPLVRVYNPDGSERFTILAYDANFRGGVHVATGDVTGDHTEDIITAAGPGGGPHVKVFDGRTGQLVREWMAYDPAFRGGVFVAAGDVKGGGIDDVVTGAGPGGGPHVKVFDGTTGAEVRGWMAYDPAFRGGVTVAAGPFNLDSFADIVTGAGPGGGPHVKVFDVHAFARGQPTVLHSFFAYEPAMSSGVFVAALDVTGDGLPEVVTAPGAGAVPNVRAFNVRAGQVALNFMAFDPAFRGGVTVAGTAIGPSGFDLLLGAGSGGGPHVRVLDPTTLAEVRGFYAFDPAFRGGVFVG
jgi:hypothetical protein